MLVVSAIASGVTWNILKTDMYSEEEQKQQIQHMLEKTNEVLIKRDDKINKQEEIIQSITKENEMLRSTVNRLKEEVSRGETRTLDVQVTAYTLSAESCGKNEDDLGYGITANGTNLSGHTVWSARAIAVDPNIIPLGSKIQISFNDPDFKQYDGVYTAVDTGNGIEGNRIDLFIGEYSDDEAIRFGIQSAKLRFV